MSTSLATVIFAVGIVALFLLDRNRSARQYKALWIPTLWLFFCLSRAASQWLGMTPPPDLSTAYVEGSPLDRVIFIALEAAALVIIFRRWQRIRVVLLKNWPFLLFFLYAALSIFWSDFPFVTLKHWIKGMGDLMMTMIILSETDVADAIKQLFTRLGFILLPLSVLFIKYYPQLGRVLNLSWSMEPVGVATQKNGLGELCDFLGLFLIWRFRNAYCDEKDPRRKQRLFALGAVLSMVVWLLWTCDSMTSICGLSMATAVMFALNNRMCRRRPILIHAFILGLLSCTLYAIFLQSSGSLIADLGRNPTLTGRTDVWHLVLSIPNNRLVGAGYESFWLGNRLQLAWQAFPNFHLQEAHNGYIEIFLNLGWIGVVLLALLIVAGYRTVMTIHRRNPEIGSLMVAFFLATVITGLTEAAFRMMGPPWLFFLLATAAGPAFAARKSRTHGGRRTPLPCVQTHVLNQSKEVTCG